MTFISRSHLLGEQLEVEDHSGLSAYEGRYRSDVVAPQTA
jgi:hypothetical protein